MQDDITYMLDRSNLIFKYTGLPDTIPEHVLEYQLQTFGYFAFIQHEGNYYALRCSMGGAPDPYYRPTNAVVANPGLGLSQTYRIANHLRPYNRAAWDTYPDCIICRNDCYGYGLLPLYSRYAAQLAENRISLRMAQINYRQQSVIAADTGTEIESANAYIDNLEMGRLASIQKRPFMDGITVFDVAAKSHVMGELIQMHQYLKASWYNDLGISANEVFKSQYVSTEEVTQNKSGGIPLIEDMLKSRREWVGAVNGLWGLSISVSLTEEWEELLGEKDEGMEDASGAEEDEPAAAEMGEAVPGQPDTEEKEGEEDEPEDTA